MVKAGLSQEKEVAREIHALLWRINMQQGWSFFLAYAMRLPAFICESILVPLYIAYAVGAIFARNFALVPHYAVMVLIFMVGYGIFFAIGGWAVSKNAIVGCDYAQRLIFANYLQKDYEFYSNTYFGALGAQAVRFRDTVSDFGKLITLDIPRQAITIGAGLIVIGYKAPILALVTLVCMVVVLSYTIATSKYRMRYRHELSEAGSELSGVIGDALSHSTTVKSFATEDYEQKRLGIALDPWKKAQFITWLSSTPAEAGRNILAALTISILLILTARMYQHGSITITIVTLVQLYVIKMIAATQDVADIIKTYETVMGVLYQPVRTMLIRGKIADPDKPKRLTKNTAKHVRLENITYKYPEADKKSIAITNLSLDIKNGERIGLVGYSGSGKTTLTKLLLRFMDVDEGSVRIGGIDIRDLRQQDLRRLISYVPQEPLLFHRSIAENIQYGKPGASKAAILKAARMANADEFITSLPQKYDTLVGERGVKLSGGQRQRVAIARAILKDAPILLLDEATSALDSKSEKLIQDALWQLMKGRTALVIAHRLSTIQKMDRIAVMDKGRIVQIGTHNELLRNKNGIYAKLWAHQSGGYIGEAPKKSAT